MIPTLLGNNGGKPARKNEENEMLVNLPVASSDSNR